jgi:hypothetical protein
VVLERDTLNLIDVYKSGEKVEIDEIVSAQ